MKLDESVLAPLREVGGEELVRKLLQTFVDHAPTRRAELEVAVKARDLPALERAVHSLRSGAAMLGASELSSLAGRLEQLAADHDLEGVLAGVPALEAEMEEVVSGLERELAAGPT